MRDVEGSELSDGRFASGSESRVGSEVDVEEERWLGLEVEDLGELADEGLVGRGVDEVFVGGDVGPVDGPDELLGVFDAEALRGGGVSSMPWTELVEI